MLHTAGSFLLKKTGYLKRNLELKTQPQWWVSECDQLKLQSLINLHNIDAQITTNP